MKKYYQTILLLKNFNDYLSSCICPAIYARNRNLQPFPEYSHNHGGFLNVVNELNISKFEFDKWHLNELAKNYLYSFFKFKDKNFTNLISETIKNEPNMQPTQEEKELVFNILYGGKFKDEILENVVLPVLQKIFLYRFENLWGRHYMEVPHNKEIKKYPNYFIPPTAKDDVRILETTNETSWSIEIDLSPFTWSMITIPFENPIGFIPIKKLNGIFSVPKIYKREHLVVSCEDININEWFFTYNKNFNNYELKTFYQTGILPTKLTMEIWEITGKMISLIAALKNFKIKNYKLTIL